MRGQQHFLSPTVRSDVRNLLHLFFWLLQIWFLIFLSTFTQISPTIWNFSEKNISLSSHADKNYQTHYFHNLSARVINMLNWFRWSCWHAAWYGTPRPSERSQRDGRNVWKSTELLSNIQSAGLRSTQRRNDSRCDIRSLLMNEKYQQTTQWNIFRSSPKAFQRISRSLRSCDHDKLLLAFQSFPSTHRRATSRWFCLSALRSLSCIKTRKEI